MTFLELLATHGLDPTPTSGGSELMMACPLCSDAKQRLYVNAETGRWICFLCEERGGAYLLCRNVLEMDHFEARNTIKKLDIEEPTGIQLQQEIEQAEILPGIQLPAEYERLTNPTDFLERPFWRYLRGRGLTDREIVDHDIGYCVSGQYRWRVIIPVRSRGILWTFVARAISPATEPRILHPQGAQPHRALFGIDECELFAEDMIVLVEGAFDALKLGTIAVATLGTNISAEQRDLLHWCGITGLILMWDGDEPGRRGARKVSEPLLAAGFKLWLANLPDGEDVDSASWPEIRQSLLDAQPATLGPVLATTNRLDR